MRDLISREDAIEALRGLFDMRKSRAKVIVECFGELINALPSADAVHIEVYRDLYERYVDLKHTSDLVYRPSVDADCSTCKHKDKDWDSEECDSCCGNNNHYESADAEPMTEEVREALMRLAMCAREECAMCKYKGECDYDFQYNISTDNMNTLSDALMRSRCEVDAKSAEANHESCEDCPLYDTEKHSCPRFNKVIPRTIAEAVQGWIPCNERLPKENARYLVQMSYGIMQVLSWANILEKVDDFDFYNEKHGGWYELDSEWGYCERHEVVAWMPLPKPYKGGDDE